MDVDPEVASRGSGEAHRRAGVEVLGGRRRGALGQRVGRVAGQGQLGQEDDRGAGLGRRADAVPERLDEGRWIVDPLVLDEADPHGGRVGLVDSGKGLWDAIGLEKLHSRKYANTRAPGPSVSRRTAR